MRESIFISKTIILSLTLAMSLVATSALAQQPPPTAQPPGGGKSSPSSPPVGIEEDDFSTTPYTEYAAFDEEKEEEEETRFLRYGRLYAVSVGTGFQGVTGYRGVLWQGGFPVIDLKLHYWFDFNLALDLNFYMTSHYYDTGLKLADISFNRIGADLKYYVDVHNLSSAISVANPYFIVGVGSYSKTEADNTEEVVENKDSSIGVSGGLGLEFALKPRKVYLTMEGKMHFPTFKDNYSQTFNEVPGIPNLTGYFYTLTVSLLFSW